MHYILPRAMGSFIPGFELGYPLHERYDLWPWWFHYDLLDCIRGLLE